MTPKYKLMTQEYEENVELPMLKEQERKIKNHHFLYQKKMDHDKLNKHCKSYTELRRKELVKLQRKHRKRIEQDMSKYDPSKYITNTTRKVYKEDLLEKTR